MVSRTLPVDTVAVGLNSVSNQMYVHLLANTFATPIVTLGILAEQQAGGMPEVTDACFRTAGSTVRLLLTGLHSLAYSLVEVLRSDALPCFLFGKMLVASSMCACDMLSRK